MAYFDKYGVEFSDDRKRLVSCPQGYKGEYAVPEGTNCIASCAFLKCEYLTCITLPQSVVSIEEKAFKYCTRIATVRLPDSLTNIGKEAFQGCYSLKTIEIPDNDEIEQKVRSFYSGKIRRRKKTIIKTKEQNNRSCLKCGFGDLPSDALFCPECGTKLS